MVAAGPPPHARGAARQQQQPSSGAHAVDHSRATTSSYSRSASRPRARKQAAPGQPGAVGSGTQQRSAAEAKGVEESEERRVQLLTESVLYDLLPAALQIMLPQTGEEAVQHEPDMDKCRAVASAAMCVSCLLNTPPGFLEFLLCVPWRKLSQLYPKSESIDKLISNLHVTEDERRRLVNTRIDPALMPTVLDFLFRADHADSLPPMLQLSKQPQVSGAGPSSQPGSATQQGSGSAAPQAQGTGSAGLPNGAAPTSAGSGASAAAAPLQGGELPIVLETIAAVLDGATPLHCAALRGNPAQVDHLLACGADPSVRTAAGELALEMVPVCSDFDLELGQRVCRCMGPLDQEVWECRSSLARSLVARQSLFFFRRGLFTWLQMVLLALLCWFGYWGWHTSISRPCVEHHVVACRERKRQEARSRAQGLMSRMRAEAQQGHLQLSTAKQEYIATLSKPDPDKALDPTRPANGISSSSTCQDVAVGASSLQNEQRLGRAGLGGPNLAAAAAAAVEAVAGGPSVASSSSSSEHGIAAAEASQTGVEKSGSSGAAPTLCRCSVALVAAGKLKEANVQEGSGCYGGEGSACEAAFRSFVVAVHSLQGLDLQGDTVPKVLTDTVDVADESYQTHVLEDEQADLYCSWSESVLLKFRSCSCPSCTALTVQAVRMAHIQCARLFARVEQRKAQMPGRWQSVGQSLARAVFTHICLLLDTEARLSPTKASLWRSEQCLREWSKLAAQGLAPAQGEWLGPAPPTGARGEAWVGVDLAKVEELQQWTRHADSDLYLAEALLGSPLGTGQPLSESLALAVTQLPTGEAYLTRPATTEVLQQLDQAITLACSPSPEVGQLARSVARCCSEELQAAVRLRDAVNGRGLPSGTLDAAAVLAAAMEAATAFPRLVAEVAAARELHARWLRRSEAVDRLDSVVEAVRQYTLSFPLSTLSRGERDAEGKDRGEAGAAGTSGSGTNGNAPVTSLASSQPSGSGRSPWSESTGAGAAGLGAGGTGGGFGGAGGTSDLAEWQAQLHVLEEAINEAKDANVGVSKAKRLLKEMQAQAAAAEAARQLEGVMSRRPAGSGALRGALSKAEEAATALSSAGGAHVLNDVLLPLIQAGRRRLEMERAAEALHKAAGTCRALPDLPRLEAAILTARKLGAEELDAESYRVASDTLGKLHEAARCRAALDAAVKALGRGLKGSEDAEVVERVLGEATRWGEGLLAPDVARARESLEHWKSQTASEARLARALSEGSTTQSLARAIQEAAAAGVKVQSARRVLKLMQGVEAAMVPGPEGAVAQAVLLRSRLEAAEQAGVVSPLMASARRMLWRLGAAAAREALEAALRPHSDWPPAQRLVALRAALARAEAVVGAPISAASLGLPTVERESGEQETEAKQAAVSGSDDMAVDAVSRVETSAPVADTTTAATAAPPSPPTASPSSTPHALAHKAPAMPDSKPVDGPAACVGPHSRPAVESSLELPSALSTAASSDPSNMQLSPANGLSSTSPKTSPSDSPATAPMTSEDEALLASVVELAGKAWHVVEEDERQVARLDAERAAAEKARREQVERDKQERLRQEQARHQKEKAELAERERAAAEKRDKAKADKGKAALVVAKSLVNSKAGAAGSGLVASAQAGAQGGGKGGAAAGAPKGSAKEGARSGEGGDTGVGRPGARRGAAAAAPQPVVPPLANGWAPYGPPPPPPPPRTPPSVDSVVAAGVVAAAAGGLTAVGAAPKLASSAPPTPNANGESEFAHPHALRVVGPSATGATAGTLDLPPVAGASPASQSLGASTATATATASTWGALGLGLPTPAPTLSLLPSPLHPPVVRPLTAGPLLVMHGRMDSTESLGEAALSALDSDMLLALELGGAVGPVASGGSGSGAGTASAAAPGPVGSSSKAGGRGASESAGGVLTSASLSPLLVAHDHTPSACTTPSSPGMLPVSLPSVLDAPVTAGTAVSGGLGDSLAAMSPNVPSQVQAAWGTASAGGATAAAAALPGASLGLSALTSTAPSTEASWGSGIGLAQGAGDAPSLGAVGSGVPPAAAGAVLGPAGGSAGVAVPVFGHGGGGSGRGFGAGIETASQHTCSSHFSSATSADEVLAGPSASALSGQPFAVRQPSLPRAPAPQPTTNAAGTDTPAVGAPASTAGMLNAAPASAAAAGGPPKPKIEFVDLGGARWMGLDNPLMPGPSAAGLAPSGLLMLPTLQELSSAWQQFPASSGTGSFSGLGSLGLGTIAGPTQQLSPLWGLPSPAHSSAGEGARAGSASRPPSGHGAGVGAIAAAAGGGVQLNGAPMSLGSPSVSTGVGTGPGSAHRLIDWPASEVLAMAAASVTHAASSPAAVGGSNVTPARGHHHAGGGSSAKACRYFLAGFCRDGERCRFLHPRLGEGAAVMAGKAAPVPSLTQQQQAGAAGAKLALAMHKQMHGLPAASGGLGGYSPAPVSNGHPTLPDELSFSPSVSPRVHSQY